MQIAGLQRCSMVDYPGKVAAVVFTPGCNMNCHYCHNRSLIGQEDNTRYESGEVIEFLTRRRRMLDGLVVTGGEPTLQRGLAAFLVQVRPLGLAIKLDTNGTRPGVVKSLLNDGLVDFVAMDIKAPFSRYGEICGADVDPADLQETVSTVAASGIDHEFRTTVSPLLTTQDLLHMAGIVEGGHRLVLQKYRPPADGDTLLGDQLPETAPTPSHIHDVARRVSQQALPCTVRGF